MTILELLFLLLIAGICGSVAQSIAGFSRGGCLVAVAIGFIGALLGSKLAEVLGLPEILSLNIGGKQFPVIWSIVGGALFAAVIAFLTRGRRSI